MKTLSYIYKSTTNIILLLGLIWSPFAGATLSINLEQPYFKDMGGGLVAIDILFYCKNQSIVISKEDGEEKIYCHVKNEKYNIDLQIEMTRLSYLEGGEKPDHSYTNGKGSFLTYDAPFDIQNISEKQFKEQKDNDGRFYSTTSDYLHKYNINESTLKFQSDNLNYIKDVNIKKYCVNCGQNQPEYRKQEFGNHSMINKQKVSPKNLTYYLGGNQLFSQKISIDPKKQGTISSVLYNTVLSSKRSFLRTNATDLDTDPKPLTKEELIKRNCYDPTITMPLEDHHNSGGFWSDYDYVGMHSAATCTTFDEYTLASPMYSENLGSISYTTLRKLSIDPNKVRNFQFPIIFSQGQYVREVNFNKYPVIINTIIVDTTAARADAQLNEMSSNLHDSLLIASKTFYDTYETTKAAIRTIIKNVKESDKIYFYRLTDLIKKAMADFRLKDGKPTVSPLAQVIQDNSRSILAFIVLMEEYSNEYKSNIEANQSMSAIQNLANRLLEDYQWNNISGKGSKAYATLASMFHWLISGLRTEEMSEEEEEAIQMLSIKAMEIEALVSANDSGDISATDQVQRFSEIWNQTVWQDLLNKLDVQKESDDRLKAKMKVLYHVIEDFNNFSKSNSIKLTSPLEDNTNR